MYLGGNEAGTHEYVSKALGKASITITNHSQSKGKSGSYSSSDQVSGRELLLPDEVRTMDNADCILFIRGEPPVMDKKYDILRHPHVRLTPDGGGEAYRHGELTCFSDDLAIDMTRFEDYQLLTVDDVLGTAENETEEFYEEDE